MKAIGSGSPFLASPLKGNRVAFGRPRPKTLGLSGVLPPLPQLQAAFGGLMELAGLLVDRSNGAIEVTYGWRCLRQPDFVFPNNPTALKVHLRIGLYHLATGERLRVTFPQDRQPN